MIYFGLYFFSSTDRNYPPDFVLFILGMVSVTLFMCGVSYAIGYVKAYVRKAKDGDAKDEKGVNSNSESIDSEFDPLVHNFSAEELDLSQLCVDADPSECWNPAFASDGTLLPFEEELKMRRNLEYLRRAKPHPDLGKLILWERAEWARKHNVVPETVEKEVFSETTENSSLDSEGLF